MDRISKYLILISLFFVIVSCNKKENNSHDFISYINDEDNLLIQKKSFNDVSFILMYEPVDLKALQDLNFKPKSKEVFDKKKTEYEGMVYFKFRLQSKDNINKSPFKSILNNKLELGKLKEYCSTYLINDFYIETEKLTKKPDLFFVEEDFNMLNYNQISLAFDSTNLNISKNGFTFVYNDQLLNNGLLKFKITAETLNSIPKFNYNL